MQIKLPGDNPKREIKINAKILFEPRDMWIGLYWDTHKSPGNFARFYNLYFCLVPMLPIRVSILAFDG